MKKWILALLSYGLGWLFIYDSMNNFPWLGDQFQALYDWNHRVGEYAVIVILMIVVVMMLINYMALRLRTKNPVFTMVNSLFMTIFIVGLVMTNRYSTRPTFEAFTEVFLSAGEWKTMWQVFQAMFYVCGFNFISGIVISEAKTKGTYLTAEFVYLFSGIIIVLFSTRFIF